MLIYIILLAQSCMMYLLCRKTEYINTKLNNNQMKKLLLTIALLTTTWLAGGTAWAHDGDHTYNDKGICTIDGCTDQYQPATLNSGWYELRNAGNIEWFGAKIADAATDPANDGKKFNVASYKMMNDIDFNGVTHSPIGPNAQQKFNGVFDGNGYKISNLAVSATNTGFFCWVRGGSTIKNLTFDRTCSFTATDRCAAFVCVVQVADAGSVEIENCVNYANVTSTNLVASGFVAACNWDNNDQPIVNITNCVNAGNISSTNDKTAAFFGWNKSAKVCTITNCINIGTLSAIDDTHNLARGNNYDNLSFVNCYDLVNTTAQGKAGTDGVISAPSQDGNGYYELTNAIDVEWFSQQVAGGNLTINGKMMNDIDFYSIENLHSPIGPNTGQKFNGTFDGQGFRIKNLIIERPSDSNIGFFGFLRGNNANTTVKNLIMDASCTIHAYNRVGGITGSCQNNGALITLENIINEATVIAEHQDAAGIIGGQEGNGPKWLIRNVVNVGTITAKNASPYAGALCSTLGGNGESVIENFVNLGTINGHNGGNIGRIAGSAANIIDLSETTNKTQGVVAGLTTEDIANGKLAWYINNNDTQGDDAFFQTIGTDAYPVPFSDGHSQVYQDNCEGTPADLYSNTVGGETHSHVAKANGFCKNCNTNLVTSLTQDSDGYYLISNAGELEKFSDMVETGGQSTANKAKLTADIDMAGVTHKPIGGGANDSNKFNSTFDGQNHTISNMTSFTRTENVGLFSWVRGGSIIKNLIIDETCSVTGTDHVAAFVGKIQAGSNVRFENCINKANITSSGNHAAAFVGKSFTDGLKTNMVNCGNAGRITAVNNACALHGWNTGGTIKNCWNVGEIVKGSWDKENSNGDGIACHTLNFYNNPGGASISIVNSFDASASESRSQGTLLAATAATSGELTYKIGGDWRQTVGIDAHPMLAATSQVVNQYSESIYTNLSVSDGKAQISNVADLQKYAVEVNAVNNTMNAEMTADIDMSEEDYTPIGTNDKRFSGTFDGKGHKVNLDIDANAYGQGFISIATGGATVKNLVITGKVKNAGSKTAGIIAEAIGGGTITIQNCGNEATIEGAGGEVAAIVANNWGYQCTLNLENVYNIGNVSGTGDVSTICACQGNGSSVFKNVYNAGSVTGAKAGDFVRTSSGTYTNCYSTTLSGNDNASIISTDATKVASGELCAKLGYGFRQTVGTGYPCFNQALGFVNQISAAGYSTQYNTYSDVIIPDGIEAFAGVKNGSDWLRLVPIEGNIAQNEPVILRGNAGLYNFMPTTGISKATNNELLGSDGTVSGGTGIYALAIKSDVVGFYPVGSEVKIPEGKAYLNDGAGVKGFTFVFEDDATGIESIQNSKFKIQNEGSIYNLAGQKLSKMQKGINIVNGRKVLF